MDYKKLLFTAINASIDAGKRILEIYESDDFNVEFKSDDSPLTKADKASNELIVTKLKKYDIPILSEEGKTIDYNLRKDWKFYWLIDPLDGTKEFIKKNGEFTVNIALIKNNYPILGVIYAPVLNHLYFAAEGVGSYKMEIVNAQNSVEDYLNNAEKLPNCNSNDYVVVASRSHLSEETEEFINKLKTQAPNLKSISKGSSLKICLVAEGTADLYPRFAPTMEWDIAAGHAIVLHSGGNFIHYTVGKEIEYNKENLLNPWFLVISNKNKFNI